MTAPAALRIIYNSRFPHGRVRGSSAVKQKEEQCPGAGVMEADDLQASKVFTVRPSFHHRHSTNRVS